MRKVYYFDIGMLDGNERIRRDLGRLERRRLK